ncbi:MAG: DUF3800 domain-containing protein, partial [Dehalococcoidia bacterium]
MTGNTNNRTPTHLAFSDESHYNVGRYRSIGLVTAKYSCCGRLEAQLEDILKRTNVKELKWQKLDANNDRQAAMEFVECAVRHACAGNIRIDVLVWDTGDSRHKVVGRDDTANMHRMYYHLFKNVLAKRWPDGSTWHLYPDKQASIDWSEIAWFLDMASTSVGAPSLLSDLMQSLINEFNVLQVEQRNSEAEPLIQMADLFGGMGVYSRDKYEHFRCWQLTQRRERQIPLLSDTPAKVALSNADKMRCPVIDRLSSLCKASRLTVGLKSSRGLRTRNPANPINFWPYQPQVGEDKAPV